jgi:hypothetical protein
MHSNCYCLAYSLIHSFTWLPIHWQPIHPLIWLPIHLPAHSLIQMVTFIPAYLFTHSLGYPLTDRAHSLIHFISLPTCSPTTTSPCLVVTHSLINLATLLSLVCSLINSLISKFLFNIGSDKQHVNCIDSCVLVLLRDTGMLFVSVGRCF